MASCYERTVCEKGFANDKNQWETLMDMRTVLGFFLECPHVSFYTGFRSEAFEEC